MNLMADQLKVQEFKRSWTYNKLLNSSWFLPSYKWK